MTIVTSNEFAKTVAVLAGGIGSRLGADKALQLIAGRTMISRVVEEVSKIADELVVVIGYGEEKMKYSGGLPDSVRVINDEQAVKAPLMGMVTALRAVSSECVGVVACDNPFVSSRVIELLFKRAMNTYTAVPRWKSGHLEPLQAVYRKLPALRQAEEALAEGRLSLANLVRRLPDVAYVSVEEEIAGIDAGLRTFFNVNTRKDIATAEKAISENRSVVHRDWRQGEMDASRR